MIDYNSALTDDQQWNSMALQSFKYVEVNILQPHISIRTETSVAGVGPHMMMGLCRDGASSLGVPDHNVSI